MLKVDNISFNYTEEADVLKNISFQLSRGEFLAVVGESGCGKSTLLEIIYGLLHVEEGHVYWDDVKLLGPNYYLIPGEYFMKYLPQDYNLMPYITVEENVGKHISYRDPNRKKRIEELLEVVDMPSFIKTKVSMLSEGQKQRVALAKVLAQEPEVLLLDEPFSHIDNFRKHHLRRNIFKYLKEKNITCIVATHDANDALSFADEILIIRHGDAIAYDTPEQIYKHPKNKYIGSLFNEINELPKEIFGFSNSENDTALLYPSQIKIVSQSDIKAMVISSYFVGEYYLLELNCQEQKLFVNSDKYYKPDSSLYLAIEK